MRCNSFLRFHPKKLRDIDAGGYHAPHRTSTRPDEQQLNQQLNPLPPRLGAAIKRAGASPFSAPIPPNLPTGVYPERRRNLHSSKPQGLGRNTRRDFNRTRGRHPPSSIPARFRLLMTRTFSVVHDNPWIFCRKSVFHTGIPREFPVWGVPNLRSPWDSPPTIALFVGMHCDAVCGLGWRTGCAGACPREASSRYSSLSETYCETICSGVVSNRKRNESGIHDCIKRRHRTVSHGA